VPHSEYVVVMNNGRVTAHGQTQEMIAAGKLGEDIQKSRPGSASASRIPSRVPSSLGESGETLVDKNGAQDNLSKPKIAKKEHKKMDAMDEERSTGAVKWPVLKLYLGALGSWWFWTVTCCVFALQQLSGVASNLWIKEWANQYTTEQVSMIHMNGVNSHHNYVSASPSSTYFTSFSNYVKSAHNGTALSALVEPQVNVHYYLTILAALGLVGAVAAQPAYGCRVRREIQVLRRDAAGADDEPI
jgi:hypothetical protein